MDTQIQSRKKSKLVVLLIPGALLVAAGLVVYGIAGGRVETTDDAYVTGRIHSIASKVPGTVQEVYVDDNQAVKEGQVLLSVDPIDYELQAQAAAAELEAEKVKLSDAQTNITTAQISLAQATRDKTRAENLFKENVLPKEKYEKAVTVFQLAVEQLKAARANKELEKALVNQKEAALNTAERNLGYTKISAPSDGYVTNKFVESGNQVQAGQPLMAVVALHDIWIVANFKETQLKSVRPGQQVKIKVDTYPGKIFTGRVDSIMVGTGAAFSLFPPENALGNYVKVVQRIPVKIVFDQATDDQHILRIGMSCVPRIATKK